MNIQILGPPGAGKTTLVKALAKEGVEDRSSYRPYADPSVLTAFLYQVAFLRKRTTLQDIVLRKVDSAAAATRKEAMDYWKTCSQAIMSLDAGLEQTNLLLKRLTIQIAVWGRLKARSGVGIYDDHFYQNILSFCALRQADIGVIDLLRSTPYPDVAIVVEGDPALCLRNMRNRRRGPPEVLATKQAAEVLQLLERCCEVVSVMRHELPKLGVTVISQSDYGSLDQLLLRLHRKNA